VTAFPSSEVESAPAPGALRRNRAFQLLWAGAAAAFLGLFEVEVAVPLVLLALTRSAGLASLFGVVQATAMVLFGAPAGAVLDRCDRRRILITAECLRVVTLVSVVAAVELGRLTLVHLLVVAAVLGGTQPFGTARILLVRAVVPAKQFTAAVTAEEVRTNAAELGGPPLGGFLFGLSQVLPFVVGAAAFAFSAVTAFFVRVPTRTQEEPEPRSGIFSGLDVVLRDPAMRAVVIVIMLVNGIAWPARFATIVLLQRHGTPPWQIGVALTGFAIGGLAGTAIVKPVHRLLAPGMLLLAVGASQVLVLLALAVPAGPWWAGAACLGYGLGIPSIRVLMDILIVRRIPDAERGRALSGVFTLFGLVVPVAMLCSGLLLQYLSPTVTLAALAGTLSVSMGLSATRRAVRRAEWPDDGTGADEQVTAREGS
jgi:predicted MFS family arabinose efflux permease